MLLKFSLIKFSMSRYS
jgi:hypothetical protein